MAAVCSMKNTEYQGVNIVKEKADSPSVNQNIKGSKELHGLSSGNSLSSSNATTEETCCKSLSIGHSDIDNDLTGKGRINENEQKTFANSRWCIHERCSHEPAIECLTRMDKYENKAENAKLTKVVRHMVTRHSRNYWSGRCMIVDNKRHFHSHLCNWTPHTTDMPIYNTSVRNMPGHILNIFYGGSRTGTRIIHLTPTFAPNLANPEVNEMFYSKIKLRLSLSILRESQTSGECSYFLAVLESFFVPLRHRKSSCGIRYAPWRFNLHCPKLPIDDAMGERFFSEGEHFSEGTEDTMRRVGVTILGKPPNMYGIYRRQMYTDTKTCLTWQFALDD